MKLLSVSALLLLASSAFAQQHTKTAAALVSKMTLEEKARLVVGLGMRLPGLPEPAGGPAVGQTMDKVEGAAGTTFAIPKLGLPTTVLADGPAGVRIAPFRNNDSSKNYYCTAFPIGTLLASSWDTELVKRVGIAMGNEVKEYGIDILLAPALNIHRNPLAGRNFEYYSEDPIVAGRIATAMVNGIESNGVGTSIKHFAANNQETNRNQINTIASERALREIYLRGFEITVKESQPWTIMSSYNRINGTYASESYDLLTTILRKEWGYKGLVMTDWFGGKDAAAQMKAGNDLLMPGTPTQLEDILKAVKNGSLSEAVLTENATRITAFILASPAYAKYKFSNKPNLQAHATVARQAAADGMILLKNNGNTLPLTSATKKIAAFGNTSYDFIAGGSGSGDVNEAYTVSLAAGLNNAGFVLDETLQSTYTNYIASEKAKQPKPQFFFILPPPIAEMNVPEALLLEKANQADIAFVTIGRNAGEFKDRKQENDFDISATEIALLKNVSAAFHAKGKKVVVILNIGGVIETDSWRQYADAILLAWQGGQEGGNAVADVLKGVVNPSGKLTTSFPLKYSDEPSAKNFPGIELSKEDVVGMLGIPMGKPSQVTYEEGIYVGYRYYQSFKVPVAFPFGFGLSYSSFSFSNLKLSATSFSKNITATVEVTNTSKTAGKEVVQLYLSAPAQQLEKPTMELKGFAKTKLLQPGEKQIITISLQPKDLASFDVKQTAWIAEKGTYNVQVGNSSANITQQATFQLAQTLLVEKCNKVLVPQVAIQEISARK